MWNFAVMYVLQPPKSSFVASKSVKNLKIKKYVVIISCQDVIVGDFYPWIFPSCHDLFLVQIPINNMFACGVI